MRAVITADVYRKAGSDKSTMTFIVFVDDDGSLWGSSTAIFIYIDYYHPQTKLRLPTPPIRKSPSLQKSPIHPWKSLIPQEVTSPPEVEVTFIPPPPPPPNGH